MCGIAGIHGIDREPRESVARMLGGISHRGPDDEGVWHDDSSPLALGHRRLSIVDLSPAGHQPMVSASGRLVITYNGEIYNFRALRSQLEAAHPFLSWRGHSDTEVLLECIERFGLDSTLQMANGMFAFGLWDRETRTLTLARDRMGEKPLYFGWIGKDFVFCSELNALRALPDWNPRLHPEAIRRYLLTGYISGMQSAVAGLFRLPPGTYRVFTDSELRSGAIDEETLASMLVRYWHIDVDDATAVWASNESSTAVLESLVEDAVRLRMLADVPIGCFLSGGIDSSLVASVMQSLSPNPIKTFCIGFGDHRLDESRHAEAVAAHLGSDHVTLRMAEADAVEMALHLADVYDEPFADPSQIPTLLLSRLTRGQVTVALSGDGGDELFAGYGRYAAILRMLQWRHVVGERAFSVALSILHAVSGSRLLASSRQGWRLRRFVGRNCEAGIEDMRLRYISPAASPVYGTHGASIAAEGASPLRQLLHGDQIDYLPNNILVKVDRASMHYGLEARIPLLDPRIVEFSCRLADAQLHDGRIGKLPLRNLLYKHVPCELIERPKQGFTPPLGAWLRGPLKDWAHELISRANQCAVDGLDAQDLKQAWHLHQARGIDRAGLLWPQLMLLDWLRKTGATSA